MKLPSLAPVLLFPLLACSSAPAPSLINTWTFSGPGGNGNTLTLSSNGTYSSSVLQLVSATVGNAQTETGTYTSTATTLTFSPTEWSCAEPTDPRYSASYKLTGNELSVTFTIAVIEFQVETAAASTLKLTTGCFLADGNFVPAPPAPVDSCSPAGRACTSSTSCCLGNVCEGSACTPECTQDSDCPASQCCVGIDTVTCTNASFSDCGYCTASAMCSPDAG